MPEPYLFGQGTYGIESASLYYFGKHVQDDLAEAATLAAILKALTIIILLKIKDSKARQEVV